eukprot:CAMPEP_0114589894 /NCGR_PEP_ID=MMETSP0125-20121206/12242_1 /TAXON_ID=485358 ORGANISM="Aristerostoma sp., Strain ATCC 50986" /NCGR_SAMPLE_ID=MMETSP0125 /ASSEMBLY_ACC=CAM_ASM_000245 /LENGTH=72 /DNA_ID=CAMNT_0001787037 /DNA_START=599 /DNA_END=817 /DNA_ORIENTATION=-
MRRSKPKKLKDIEIEDDEDEVLSSRRKKVKGSAEKVIEDDDDDEDDGLDIDIELDINERYHREIDLRVCSLS